MHLGGSPDNPQDLGNPQETLKTVWKKGESLELKESQVI